MAVGSATDTPASGTKMAGGIDTAALAMLLKDSIAAAAPPLQRELGALSERVRVAEASGCGCEVMNVAKAVDVVLMQKLSRRSLLKRRALDESLW